MHLEDAAGNTAAGNAGRTTVRYDTTAPAATSDLTISSTRVDTDPTFHAFFNPPSGQQAPLTEAVWRLCPQATSGGCLTATFPAEPNGTNHFSATVPGYGDWTLAVRLRDRAGNLGAAATTNLRYAAQTAAPAPASPPRPTGTTPAPATGQPSPRQSARLRIRTAILDGSRRALTVRGRTVAGATGTVRIKVAITRRGRTRTVTRAATLRDGRFGVRLRLARGEARGRIRVSAGYAGSALHSPDRTRRRAVRLR